MGYLHQKVMLLFLLFCMPELDLKLQYGCSRAQTTPALSLQLKIKQTISAEQDNLSLLLPNSTCSSTEGKDFLTVPTNI